MNENHNSFIIRLLGFAIALVFVLVACSEVATPIEVDALTTHQMYWMLNHLQNPVI